MNKKKRSPKNKPTPEAMPLAQSSSAEVSPYIGPRWILWAFLVGTFILFLSTLCPTVPGGDSGELITMAHRLGVPHPPGYPLFTILGHLATYLPFGEVAWRVNLLSAIFALLNGVVIFLLVERWLKDRWLALLSAGIFIFSPLAWRYSVGTEVFTLNNLFISLLLYISFRFVEDPSRRWAVVWAGTLGLACSHHHTIVFLAIPVFAILMWKHYSLLLKPNVFIPSLAIFALGFLPYLYLPWASQKMLMSSWGEAHTWEGFWTHFLRREYGTFQLATTGSSSLENTLSNLKYYAVDMWYQFLYVGLAVVAYGAWAAWKNRKSDFFLNLLILTWVVYTLVFHSLANMDLSNRLFYDVQSRFWLLPNTILAILLAYGVKDLLGRWSDRVKPQMVGAFVVAVLAVQVGLHYRMEDHSKNRIFYDLGRHLLENLPEKAVVFLRGDVYVNSVRYQQDVLGFRTDVRAIPFDLLWWPWMRPVVEHHYPELKFPGKVYRYKRGNLGEFTLRDFFAANWGKAPMYIGKLADFETSNLTSEFRLEPVGYLNRIRPKGETFNFADWKEDVERFGGFKSPSKDEIRDKSWEAFVYYNYWDRELEKSKFVFENALRSGDTLPLLLHGASILEKMVAHYPELPPSAWRNLGVAYQMASKTDPSYIPKMVKAWSEYLKVAPSDDPSLNQIKMVVQTAGRVSIVMGQPAPASVSEKPKAP